MSFKDVVDGMRQKQRDAFMAHVKQECCALLDRDAPITWDEYTAYCDEHGANSYERRLMHQRFDDSALLRMYEYCALQGRYTLGEFELSQHYGDAILRELAPMLAQRLSNATEQSAKVFEFWAEVVGLLYRNPDQVKFLADKIRSGGK